MTNNPAGQINSPSILGDARNAPAADAELVVAAKNGDEHAFEMLVKRHEQKLLAVAWRYAHVREDAEDIVQLSLQKAFIHLHRFEERSSFSTWLMSIAMNESLMFLRRGRARREVPVDEPIDGERPFSHFDLPDLRSDPEASYLQQEQAWILSAAVQKLSPKLKKAIELREFGELSSEETAERMGLTVSAVKTRVFHARKKLREILPRCMSPSQASEKNYSRCDNEAMPAMDEFFTSTVSA